MQGEIQYWHEGVLVLTSPNTTGRGFTVLGQPLAGGRTQTQESRMVVIAVSFVTVDRFLGVNRVAWGEWVQVYNPCR